MFVAAAALPTTATPGTPVCDRCLEQPCICWCTQQHIPETPASEVEPGASTCDRCGEKSCTCDRSEDPGTPSEESNKEDNVQGGQPSAMSVPVSPARLPTEFLIAISDYVGITDRANCKDAQTQTRLIFVVQMCESNAL